MTNQQGPATGPSDELTDVGTVNVLPGLLHRPGRWTENVEIVDSSDASEAVDESEPTEPADHDRDIREFLPMQRTPGSGPFGPGESWDVTHRPEFIARLEDRLQSGEPVALVALGMDQFQRLNLIVGAEAGDVALRNAYRVLRWTLGPRNVAYFGSDCFAALLSYDDETTVSLVSSALNRLARTDLSDRLTGVFATASAGIFVVDDPGVSADQALYEAECVLLSAKDMGDNRVAIEQFAAPYTARAESA